MTIVSIMLTANSKNQIMANAYSSHGESASWITPPLAYSTLHVVANNNIESIPESNIGNAAIVCFFVLLQSSNPEKNNIRVVAEKKR